MGRAGAAARIAVAYTERVVAAHRRERTRLRDRRVKLRRQKTRLFWSD
jgi:hypothetical protein